MQEEETHSLRPEISRDFRKAATEWRVRHCHSTTVGKKGFVIKQLTALEASLFIQSFSKNKPPAIQGSVYVVCVFTPILHMFCAFYTRVLLQAMSQFVWKTNGGTCRFKKSRKKKAEPPIPENKLTYIGQEQHTNAVRVRLETSFSSFPGCLKSSTSACYIITR